MNQQDKDRLETLGFDAVSGDKPVDLGELGRLALSVLNENEALAKAVHAAYSLALYTKVHNCWFLEVFIDNIEQVDDLASFMKSITARGYDDTDAAMQHKGD